MKTHLSAFWTEAVAIGLSGAALGLSACSCSPTEKKAVADLASTPAAADHGTMKKEDPNPSTATDGELRAVVGKLMHLELEGGFWGIIASDGAKYRLPAAPSGEWKGGEAIAATLRLLPDGPSIFQWGRPAEIVKIERRGLGEAAPTIY